MNGLLGVPYCNYNTIYPQDQLLFLKPYKPVVTVTLLLTGPKTKGIKVETFRIIRTPKVEKLSLQPISIEPLPEPLKGPENPPILRATPEAFQAAHGCCGSVLLQLLSALSQRLKPWAPSMGP